jgi:hypothetical protein
MSEYPIGVTTPLLSTDNLHKGDYIYEILPDSDLPFEKVMSVLSVDNNGTVRVVDICNGQIGQINLLSDSLVNLQKLQLNDDVRRLLNIR